MMFGQAIPAAGRFEHALMSGYEMLPTVDFHAIFGLPYFDGESKKLVWDRVAIVVEGHVACHIHQALVQPIYRRHPDRQRFQVSLLAGKQFAWTGLEFGSEGSINLITPDPRLSVGIVPVREGAAG